MALIRQVREKERFAPRHSPYNQLYFAQDIDVFMVNLCLHTKSLKIDDAFDNRGHNPEYPIPLQRYFFG